MAENPKCQGCGASIEWMVSPNGKRMPVQRVRSIYHQTRELFKRDPLQLEKGDMPGLVPTYISHFETCPAANDFSRGKR